jgi:hypothetical protein
MILGRYALAFRYNNGWHETARTDAEHLPGFVARFCKTNRRAPLQVTDLATGVVLVLEADQLLRVAERLRLETIAPSPLDRAPETSAR